MHLIQYFLSSATHRALAISFSFSLLASVSQAAPIFAIETYTFEQDNFAKLKALRPVRAEKIEHPDSKEQDPKMRVLFSF